MDDKIKCRRKRQSVIDSKYEFMYFDEDCRDNKEEFLKRFKIKSDGKVD